MLTTTIGAYPKPTSVAIETWFGAPARRPSADYDAALAEMGGEAEDLLDRAVREVVREQVEAGIDIPTDGEVRRDNYVHYHCRHFSGIDFDRLAATAALGGRRFRPSSERSPRTAISCRATGAWRRRRPSARSRLPCPDP